MNLVETIVQSISPEVFDNETIEENNLCALSDFTAILLAKLSNKEETELNQDSSGTTIIKTLFPTSEERGELLINLAENNHLQEEDAQKIVVTSAPLIFQHVHDQAKEKGLTIASFLASYTTDVSSNIPVWAKALAFGSLAAGASTIHNTSSAAQSTTQSTSTHSSTNNEEESAGTLQKIFPLLGLILLAFIALYFWNSCMQKPATTAEPSSDTTTEISPTDSSNTSAEAQSTENMADQSAENTVNTAVDESNKDDALFNLATGAGDDIDVCSGKVGNDSLKEKILSSITSVFGSAEKCSNVTTSEMYKTSLANEDMLKSAFEAAKSVPFATLNFKGKELIVNAKDADQRAELVKKLQGILPDYNISEAAPLDVDTVVKKGIEGSLAALSELEGNPATAKQIADALNIQVINFASGKFAIPQKNKVVLDKAATLLSKNADAKIFITGHTDSTGAADKNQIISENRAKAVKEYLISKGASVEQLVSKGVGSSQSIASDATKEGRFQNRRISFSSNMNQ